NYGGAKGVEFIPERNIEVILVAPPAYIAHNNPTRRDGFGDWGFLIKYRVVAANEAHGSFILTLFLQTTFPSGQHKNGSTNTIVTPTIAYAKGQRTSNRSQVSLEQCLSVPRRKKNLARGGDELHPLSRWA